MGELYQIKDAAKKRDRKNTVTIGGIDFKTAHSYRESDKTIYVEITQDQCREILEGAFCEKRVDLDPTAPGVLVEDE